MSLKNKAVIDIGTHSVKLLVGCVADGSMQVLCKSSVVTRLGKGLHETGRLQPDAIQKTANAVAEYARKASAYLPDSIRAVATSAAREATNRQELASAVLNSSGLKVEIISGEQEAEWAFRGISSDPAVHGLPLMVFDLGGGSTEFVVGLKETIYARHSLPLGALRSYERCKPSDPPTPSELAEFRAYVSDCIHWDVAPRIEVALRSMNARNTHLVGTGGNVLALARVAPRNACNLAAQAVGFLSYNQVVAATEWLWRLTLEERRNIPGMPAPRADVIITSAVIVEHIMRRFHFDTIQVSERGMRHGLLLDSCSSAPLAAPSLLAVTASAVAPKARLVSK